MANIPIAGPRSRPALHVGLTGNIASGKSTVSRMLADRGATVIDADVLARQAVEPGTPALAAVVARFGRQVLREDGTLNRERLRQIVFHDPAAREALNQIVHPAVQALRDRAVAAAQAHGDPIIISDIPLLFETGLEHGFECVVLVDAPDAERLRRLVEDRALPEADARAMMNAQWPADEKRQRSTFVISNDGSVGELADRVSDLWEQLVTLANLR